VEKARKRGWACSKSSKMKPEKKSPGRNDAIIAIWLAEKTAWRATVEISSPTLSATRRRKAVVAAIKLNTDPRRGTPKTKIAEK